MSKRAIFRAGRAAPQERSELAAALSACRRALIALGLASALVNILYLAGSLYMLEVYDRVLPSRSIATLIGLSILVLALYGFQALLDVLRGRILIRVGRSLGQSLSLRTYESIARLALHNPRQGDGLQPIRDLDQVRAFLSGRRDPSGRPDSADGDIHARAHAGRHGAGGATQRARDILVR